MLAKGQETKRRKEMNQHIQERRRQPRVKKEVPLKILTEGYDFVTQTKDISCIGTYCYVDKYIPPMTKLAITLLLPTRLKPGDANNKIQCKGVIVRTEPNSPEGFNIAIFFNEISQRDKYKISHYINQFLPQTKAAVS
jgi:hypothetical protein